MLGRLKLDVDECITAYSELVEAVFGERLYSVPFNVKGKVTARFDSAKLENAVRKVVVYSGASENDLFDDGAELGCRTFVCSIDKDTLDIVRLRSYGLVLPHVPNIRPTICQAALATSAATTFFDPVNIGERTFADHAFAANNPVDEVEGEAKNIWCPETGNLKPLVKCFVSIGTGVPRKKAFEDSIGEFLSQTVVDITTETENREKHFKARWTLHFDEKRYYRFNVEQGLQDIGLDEYKKRGAIEAATEGYLTNTAQKLRVRDCVENLKLKQSCVETSSAAIRQRPAEQTRWIVPFDRNPNFTGREAQLAQLEDKLFGGVGTTTLGVTGLGGIGKTQLVLELAYRIKDKYKDCLIIWIPATNMDSLHEAYRDCAKQLDLPDCEEDTADVKRLIQDHLSKESTGEWLLVFDNADDVDMWIAKTRFEPGAGHPIEYLPRSERGHIIFTSRDRTTAVKLAHQNIMEVLDMDADEAPQLLQKLVIPGLVNNGSDTEALLRELTYLPLAIVLAAAYINENSITYAEYLSLLAEQEEEVIDLLSEEFEEDWRYRNSKNPVAKTWLISFEQIRRRDSLAADYLSFMSCVDARDIPQSLLPSGPSPKEKMEAIGTLDAYFFVSKRPTNLALDLHRLVRLSMRNWLRKEDLLVQWSEKAIRQFEDVGEFFPYDDYRNRIIWRKCLPHMCYALESDFVDRDSQSRMSLLWGYGRCLYDDGRWSEAEAPITEELEFTKRKFGAEHPTTLTSMASLASTYGSQGRWKEAEELALQIIETNKRVSGHEHLDTLTSMHNLASLYANQGRMEEAEDLEVQVEAGERVFRSRASR